MTYKHRRREAERLLEEAFEKVTDLNVIVSIWGRTDDWENVEGQFFDAAIAPKSSPDKLLSPAVVAKNFSISKRTLRRWRKRFGIKMVHWGHKLRFYPQSEIDRLMKRFEVIPAQK